MDSDSGYYIHTEKLCFCQRLQKPPSTLVNSGLLSPLSTSEISDKKRIYSASNTNKICKTCCALNCGGFHQSKIAAQCSNKSKRKFSRINLSNKCGSKLIEPSNRQSCVSVVHVVFGTGIPRGRNCFPAINISLAKKVSPNNQTQRPEHKTSTHRHCGSRTKDLLSCKVFHCGPSVDLVCLDRKNSTDHKIPTRNVHSSSLESTSKLSYPRLVAERHSVVVSKDVGKIYITVTPAKEVTIIMLKAYNRHDNNTGVPNYSTALQKNKNPIIKDPRRRASNKYGNRIPFVVLNGRSVLTSPGQTVQSRSTYSNPSPICAVRKRRHISSNEAQSSHSCVDICLASTNLSDSIGLSQAANYSDNTAFVSNQMQTNGIYNIINSHNSLSIQLDNVESADFRDSSLPKKIHLPAIINPNMMDSVRFNQNNMLNGEVYYRSMDGRNQFKSTQFISKPSYEQIYDCIIAEDLERLNKFVLDGFGNQVYSWRNSDISFSNKVQYFMKSIPDYQSRIQAIHGAIASGESFSHLRELTEARLELLLSRDQFGATPLHKAVSYQRIDIVEGIVRLVPIALEAYDHQGRTPLHIAAMLPDYGQMYRQLVDAGAMTTVTDMYLRRPEDYLQPQQAYHKVHYNPTTNGFHDTTSGSYLRPNYAVSYFNHSSGDIFENSFDNCDENFNLETCYDCWWQQSTVPGSNQLKSHSNNLSVLNKHTRSIPSSLTVPVEINSKEISLMVPSQQMNRINVKELIRQGNLTELEDLVLQGYGDRLLGEVSSAPLVQEFIDNLPNYLDQISELHKAAARGNVREFQNLLDRYSLVQSRDRLGATPLHKAVLYGHHDLSEYIAANFGQNTLDTKDNDGRTPLHYAAALSDRSLYQMLLKYGAKHSIVDQKNKTADFYLRFPDELNLSHIMKRSQRLNANYAINLANRIKSKSPSRRKERSLSPSWNRYNNNQDLDNEIDSELISNDGSVVSNASTIMKRSMAANSQSSLFHPVQKAEINSANLKKWIEENNIEMLEGVVLEGHGDRLRQKASTVLKDVENVGSQAYIEETVPLIMNKIQNIHAAVSMGDLTCLQEGLEKKKDYILSKDHLGMTPLHKATIMGHVDVVQYILEKFPETVNARDREGRTALHYSTATTNRNGNKIYKMLVRAGADSRVRDSHGKSPDYYRVHLLSLPNESLRGPINKNGPSQGKLTNSYQKTVGGLLGESNAKTRRIVQTGIREKINSALHSGNVGQLQELLLDGYGQELVGRTSFGEEARRYLKNIPLFLDTIRELQEATINGHSDTVERILSENGQCARARDSNSFTLMHLAVIGGHLDLVNHFVENFPLIINLKDNMNRTALHLAALTGNTDIYRRLIELGFDARSLDQKGKTAEYYLRNNPAISSGELQELLALTNSNASTSLQASSRLSKLSKASSKPNINAPEPPTVSSNNGVVSGSSLKISSKPVRLPALSRPNGVKSNDSKQDISPKSEEGQENPDQNVSSVEKMDNDPNTDPKEETTDQEGHTETFAEDIIATDEANNSQEEKIEERPTADTSTVQHVDSVASEPDAQPVVIYSRGSAHNTDDDSLWTKIDDETVDVVTGEPSVESVQIENEKTANKSSPKQDNNEVQPELINSDSNDKNQDMDSAVDDNNNRVDIIKDSRETNTVVESKSLTEPNNDSERSEKNSASIAEEIVEISDNNEHKESLDIGKTTETVTDDNNSKQIKSSWSRESLVENVSEPNDNSHLDENLLSKQFKGSISKENEILNSVNVEPSANVDMMQVVYGNDAPYEDKFQSLKRNWSAESAVRSQSDSQLNWENRESSANVRYVIVKSSKSADSALKTQQKEISAKKMNENKNSHNSVMINEQQIDETMKNMTTEQGMWPETICEESGLKNENNSNEHKLEKFIDHVSKENTSNHDNTTEQNFDRLNELIKVWLEEGDLLRLEHVVIAGQGDRLLEVKSEDKQVQDFLNLVPAYREKIKNVHAAVSQGNVAEVQKILTRKRFALCRDQYGASPLHLAVMHGHIDILIYIITQFPETIDGPDNDGRTPFHYSAVLPDKQIYQILETAGANKEQKDRFGFTPKDYLNNGKLTIRDLLIKYSQDGSDQAADLWERPPTSEIVSQLTPESGSLPSTANDNVNKNNLIDDNKTEDAKKLDQSQEIASNTNENNDQKTIQILQIEPRERFSISPDLPSNEDKDENTPIEQEKENISNDDANNTIEQDSSDVEKHNLEKNSFDVQPPIEPDTDKKILKRMDTVDLTEKRNFSKSPVDDRIFETMSNEFKQSLRSEKLRLQKSTDQQLKSSEVIKPGQNGSVIDSIQNAQTAPNVKITNGMSAYGYDLTQIKDEHGRTVLHLASANEQKRNTFYKMLQQAKYLIPERDYKYRTIRDVAVMNGIKSNLQVIDQFILDCFISEQADYLRMLMLEGYDNLLSVVDSEGNDVIAVLKKNNINSMQNVIHQLAELQKTRDELHTFIRNSYIQGISSLVENDPQLVLAKSDRGRTALHLAVLFGNLDIIETLININHKAINIPDNLGRTPLHYAMAMSKMEEIGRILIHCGANKAIRDVRMRTPTYYFVYKQEIRDIKREEQNLTI